MKSSLKIPKSSIIDHKSQSLKDFVNNFNFPDPNWEDLPVGFPNLPKEGLTREENHLLEGIILAWMVSEGKGKLHVLKNTIKHTFVTVVILGVISMLNHIGKSPGWQYAKQVSAATISATLRSTGVSDSANELNFILESTMSGMLKRR